MRRAGGRAPPDPLGLPRACGATGGASWQVWGAGAAARDPSGLGCCLGLSVEGGEPGVVPERPEVRVAPDRPRVPDNPAASKGDRLGVPPLWL